MLEGGTSDPKALANTLNNAKVLAFAKTFDFAGKGTAVVTSAAATSGVVSAYVRQRWRRHKGSSNAGVQLALYFARKAPTISNVYEILADKNLLSVVQTALGISPMTAAQSVDTQAAVLRKKSRLPVSAARRSSALSSPGLRRATTRRMRRAQAPSRRPAALG